MKLTLLIALALLLSGCATLPYGNNAPRSPCEIQTRDGVWHSCRELGRGM